MSNNRGRRQDLKGRRERKYGLGDLPDIARVERGEWPRPQTGPAAPPGPVLPSAGVVPRPSGIGNAGVDVPPAELTVTSVYDAMPVRATQFLVIGSITFSSPT